MTVVLLLLLLAPLPALANATGEIVKRPAWAGPSGAVMVPDQFLQSWDPVTFFFDKDTGPAAGGAEDKPERLVKGPGHPGAYAWIDARTLQFRPAEPWPALSRLSWTVGGRTLTLSTLMPAPQQTIPAADADGLKPVDAITLRFAHPLDPAALARMVSIDLRPLPGIEGERQRTLGARDFDVKVVERAGRADPATYVLNLKAPVPWGTRAVVHLRLAEGIGLETKSHDLSFSTAEPFRVRSFGCRTTTLPATVAGAVYAREQALTCPGDDRLIRVEFSSRPQVLSPVEARNLVRLTPPVDDLSVSVADNALQLRGRFEPDKLYRVRLEPAALVDQEGRPLVMRGASELSLSFPAKEKFLRYEARSGVVERFGAQMIPLRGRGHDKVDMRIHAIDPLDRTWWPFSAVESDDDKAPPAPGEEPPPYSAYYSVSSYEIARHLRTLGTPGVSAMVPLPLHGDTGAKFGLDLKPYLEKMAGPQAPGTYLVGLRPLGRDTKRQWSRIQVTDLSLTAVEESDQVRFIVTSLATAQPVPGATIRLDGIHDRTWETMAEGETDADGQLTLAAIEPDGRTIVRVVVKKGDDVLVVDVSVPPSRYAARGGWQDSGHTWLYWLTEDPAARQPAQRALCHLFTERPIYRPEDSMHIKGYVRDYADGGLSPAQGSGVVKVEAPDGTEWRYPVDLTADAGSFYVQFPEKTTVTGEYMIRYLHGRDETDICHRKIKREAYRLPKFEVQLHGPAKVPLDAPFKVQLTARYYAGGNVIERPLQWRVTQVPYTWVPKPREGFRFSTDSRFSKPVAFRSTPAIERQDKTDVQGGAAITLDPTIEPTAQARRYVVEATVTGDDDQTVTNVQDVLALPPFVLGLKVPRYLEQVDTVAPEVLVAGPDGEGVAGQPVTVRLIKRQWNSILQAGDFSSGAAKYITEVVEEVVSEQQIRSTVEPTRLTLPLTGTGVYLVQLEAEDKLGRVQTVAVDFFAAGAKPTTWSRPPAQVFKATPEKARYTPGETAKIVLESPFQTGAALAVVEEPDGHNSYTWVPVKNGFGVFNLEVRKEYLPKLPVHFALMRGRLPGGGEAREGGVDLRKPATLAATTWIEVSPAKHRVTVDLEHVKKAQPGDTVSITVKLSDDEGKPLAGEVTLWLVDQAVLALAREQPLDPVPAFIVERPSKAEIYDTRNQVLGLLPLQEDPGGDGEQDEGNLLDQVGVRKNFTPVPYYNPRLMVGPSGTATVSFRLPDSLTNFRVRAKAVSGPDRFGFGTGEMRVRLPVIVQPALPRFVRPGDSFTLAAIGRVVEGDLGPGKATVKLDGLALQGQADRAFDWTPKPVRVDYPVSVPVPPLKPDGEPSRTEVKVTVGVERSADKARDAFEVDLPIRPDRPPQTVAQVAALEPGQPVTLAPLPEPARPGTVTRTTLVSAQPAVTLMAAALDYLNRYPYGCTEQRISIARSEVAARRFNAALMPKAMAGRVDKDVAATLAWIAKATTADGLVGFWPGARGYVALTAWSVMLMGEAKDAGLPVDAALLDRQVKALKHALRSDSGNFVDSWTERSWALTALAAVGQIDLAYAAELTRRAEFLSQEGTAQALRVLASSKTPEPGSLDSLKTRLWAGIVVRSHQGRDIFGGLQAKALPASGLILPSETRAVAQTLRAQLAAAPADPRNQLLIDALAGLGRGDGWGGTNANAEALLALADALAKGGLAQPVRQLTLSQNGKDSTAPIGGATALQRLEVASDSPATLAMAGEGPAAALWSRTSFVPAAPGSAAPALAQGFVVGRASLRLQAGGAPPLRVALDKAEQSLDYTVGTVIEDEVEVVNPADRHHVAISVPLAAGMEPLNPALATAPPEAKPSAQPELPPSYVAFLDDRVEYFYESLPKGTYHFRFRSRATIPGRFTQPSARAQLMYDDAVLGASPGAVVAISRGAE